MNSKAFLDKDYSSCIKAFAAVCVMLCHYTRNYSLICNLLFDGTMWVGIFFFYSGYGLALSIEKKKDYLDGFLQKKIKQIYFPFLLAEAIYTIVNIFLSHSAFTFTSILEIFGIKLANTTLWYPIELLILYFLFYIQNKTKINKNIFWFTGYFTFIGVSIVLDFGTWWYISTLAFIFGLFSYNRNFKIKKAFNVLISVIWIFMYLVYKLLQANIMAFSFGIPKTYLITFLALILSTTFVIIIRNICSIDLLDKKPKLLTHLGSISYEIYLYHMLSMLIVDNLLKSYSIKLDVIIVVIIATILSLALAKLFSIIKNTIINV